MGGGGPEPQKNLMTRSGKFLFPPSWYTSENMYSYRTGNIGNIWRIVASERFSFVGFLYILTCQPGSAWIIGYQQCGPNLTYTKQEVFDDCLSISGIS